jgi:hypothetical protein
MAAAAIHQIDPQLGGQMRSLNRLANIVKHPHGRGHGRAHSRQADESGRAGHSEAKEPDEKGLGTDKDHKNQKDQNGTHVTVAYDGRDQARVQEKALDTGKDQAAGQLNLHQTGDKTGDKEKDIDQCADHASGQLRGLGKDQHQADDQAKNGTYQPGSQAKAVDTGYDQTDGQAQNFDQAGGQLQGCGKDKDLQAERDLRRPGWRLDEEEGAAAHPHGGSAGWLKACSSRRNKKPLDLRRSMEQLAPSNRGEL